eukprot:TRINITY_DN370_c0_g2_i1.p1 TRINITY_DN370_c0_g2~~TRINITY_DN370_c0_g2_i1.p1  ORF type:complete len:349 (+),score=52.38 TRINITY_DN370_c0_g2_i1:195-1241(+)
MEFRLRAGENLQASSFLSSASTDGYFTTQALRAGYLATVRNAAADLRSREALQREIEKERIREEILATEIVRKRVLEEEVRRELELERGLALQQRQSATDRFPFMALSVMSSEPRVPLSHNHLQGVRVGDRMALSGRSEVRIVERLPFQRHAGAAIGPSEVKSLSPKPIIVGLKRKASDAATSVNDKPKKVVKELGCALCQVSATSEQALNDHMQGKKHKAKEEQLRANKPVTAKTKANQAKKQEEKKEKVVVKIKTEVVKKRKFAFWCVTCKVGCHSAVVMAAHCKGKKHRARFLGVEEDGGAVSGTTASAETPDKEEGVDVVAEEVKGETEENDGEVDGVAEAAVE